MTDRPEKLSLSVILMVRDEARNLAECLDSVAPYVQEIFVVDSFSSDNTVELATRYTDKIYKNKWVNYATQYRWALENLPIKNDWVLRLDADERWTPQAFRELTPLLSAPGVNGVYIKLRIYFMHKWIRHGGFYPNLFLRVFRKSKGQIENRLMDEHIEVEGKSVVLQSDILEYNLKDRNYSITEFTAKHNGYATREAAEAVSMQYTSAQMETIADMRGGRTERKRYLKEKFYYRLPLFFRAFLYFSYRYVFQLGFLDGKEGLIFHFLQGFWYRFLVDVKIYEILAHAKTEKKTIPQIIRELHNIDVEF